MKKLLPLFNRAGRLDCAGLSLALLAKEGWTATLVEGQMPGTVLSRDLFGCIDILALKGSEVLAVQSTSTGNVAARITKITDSPFLPAMREAGWGIVVHGWYRDGRVREVDLS